MGEDSSLCKTTSGQFRWLLFLRFTVALVVTVVAAVVVVRGLRLVLRPGNIQLNIPQGKVLVWNGTRGLSLRFYLEATNPSELVILYYGDNMTINLYNTRNVQGGQPKAPSQGNLLATFQVTPSTLSLSQKAEQEYLVSGFAADMGDDGALTELFGTGKFIDGATMVLNGIMAVANAKQPGINPTRYHAKFTCQPVSVTSSSKLPQPLSDESNKADCQQQE